MKSDIYFYIHIPYCYKKCPYCAFVSYEKCFFTREIYIQRLIEEIKAFHTNSVVKSVYFGGGTPSILKPQQIERIMNTIFANFNVDNTAEITFEANPVSLKEQYMKSLKLLGINRLSIGIQSFIDRKLKILGRLHNASMGVYVVKKAKDLGFNNINIDLIYGLNETKNEIKFELQNISALGVQHISTYMLTIEKGTKFEEWLENGRIKVSNDEDFADLYMFIADYLEKAGFEHYEISNFSKENFRSRHNCSYWLGYNYRGFGVSASSFMDGVRFKNTDSLKDYTEGKNIVVFREKLNRIDRLKEAFVLLLRTKKGVNINAFNMEFGIDIKDFYYDEIKKFKKLDLIKEEQGRIYLNKAKAMIVSNSILNEFI